MKHPHDNGSSDPGRRDDTGGAIITVFAVMILLWVALAMEIAGRGVFTLSAGALMVSLPVICGGVLLGIMAAVR